ncbi:glycosyltransferase family 2 protein [Thalassotalea sp. 1_MG-2023]|uniref:glycosyltransferase family 2 protein n=1 Tax=Thalassotalea sp. 1_MG-2023 TaxID=3062680 RepID=UPI0026E35EFF|nr:glycosyltransferase family 2 protein [Thalassotalea sp. 1_MG-2023]MDO6426514.1 glycosyltransferase family 2 protein [Thalassotalea sp. 1_MG-2023]
MLVSIITPSFNSEKFIEETYLSIKNQTHTVWEWLVTDDCSSDNTWKILEKLQKQDSRVKPIQNKQNSGAAVSRNNSISRAQGEFIAFLDSDDLWLPSKLELHLEFMLNNNIDLSFTPYHLIDESSNRLNVSVDMRLSGAFDYEDMLLKRATMGCCTVMVRKGSFNDLTMPLIRAGQDYALWLKLLKTGKDAFIFSKPLSEYRIVENSLSRNKYKKALKIWRVYREIEKLSLIKSCYVFSHYAVRAFFKLNQ